jgi:hypothetical protein
MVADQIRLGKNDLSVHHYFLPHPQVCRPLLNICGECRRIYNSFRHGCATSDWLLWAGHLSHAAFLAVGAYTSTLLMLQLHLPYPLTLILGGVTGGLWCVLFGLPSARVKGFYLIMTTMAAQFITVEFFITQYVSQIGGRGVAFSPSPFHPAP